MNIFGSYFTTLLVYALVDIIGVLGLNLQFAFAGIINFAFIVYVAVGAYAYAIFTLGSPSGNNGLQHYFVGVHLPFPLPFLLAAVVGCLAGAITGGVLLRRLRHDFQGLAFYALSFMAVGLVASLPHFLNGAAGLALIPPPLASTVGLSGFGHAYAWFFVALAAVFTISSFWIVQRLISTPWGRLLRALRDNEVACSALGKSPGRTRYLAFIVGCGFAALSGALLVAFITAWAPASWTFPETVVFFTAIVVGGTANNLGVTVGVVLVGVVIGQAPLFLPAFASPNVIAGMQWMLIGGLTLAFIWFRPTGLIPERIRKFNLTPAPPGPPGPMPAAVWAVSSSIGDNADSRTTGGGVRSPSRPPASTTPRPSGLDATDTVGNDVILHAEGLTKSFGGVHALAGVGFEVQRGSITGIMGPNGAGKSTLVSILAGEETPTSGRFHYEGQDVTGRNASWLARHGLVRTFQLSSEFRNLSVVENLLVGARNPSGERFLNALVGRRRWLAEEEAAIARAVALLREFGLTHVGNDKAGTLSGGQRRLVELMRALMAEPKMLLLDEPLAGIARATADILLERLATLRTQGITIVLVEHELRALHELADRVVVLARGSAISEGSMAEVVNDPSVIQAYVAG